MSKKLTSTKILRYAKKLKSINYLGGKCEKCNENNIFKLCFHHLNPSIKELKLTSDNISNIKWEVLKKELDKCIVLCQNCHREEHYINNEVIENKFRISKKIYLEYKGTSCVKCGYDKCESSLTFHHLDPSIKEFNIGKVSERYLNINEIKDKVINELDKCEVLCFNCHIIEHCDIEFFEKNKELIFKKSLNIKEKQSKIDRKIIFDLYDNGMIITHIAKKLKASKSTISKIIKDYRKVALSGG